VRGETSTRVPDESVERGSMGGGWQWEGYGRDGRWVNEVCSVVEGVGWNLRERLEFEPGRNAEK
jgi:hypothetical protein